MACVAKDQSIDPGGLLEPGLVSKRTTDHAYSIGGPRSAPVRSNCGTSIRRNRGA